MDTCFTPKIPFCILLRQMLLRLYYHGVSLILPNSTATASDTSLTGNRLLVKQQAEQILTDYGNHILRYAYSYLHNMSDAEEILQDTLVQFLKTAPIAGESDCCPEGRPFLCMGSGQKSALFRQSYGTEDNSGDYNEYADTTTIPLGTGTVLLKGDSGLYTLAIWQDTTYSYSLSLSDGLSSEEWVPLLESIR